MNLAATNWSLLAMRAIPALLAGCLAIPLLLRLKTGVIPAGRANETDIRRQDSPRAFWVVMSIHFLLFLAMAIWAILAWCSPELPPANDPSLNM